MHITDKDAAVGALHLDIYSVPGCYLLHQHDQSRLTIK
jgi:hypothetical protein